MARSTTGASVPSTAPTTAPTRCATSTGTSTTRKRGRPRFLVVLVPVEVAHLVGAVVGAVLGTDAPVVDLAIQPVGRMVGGIDRADRLARRVGAMLTQHGNEAGLHRLTGFLSSLPVTL